MIHVWGGGWGVESKDVCFMKRRGFGEQNQVLFSQYLSKIRLKKGKSCQSIQLHNLQTNHLVHATRNYNGNRRVALLEPSNFMQQQITYIALLAYSIYLDIGILLPLQFLVACLKNLATRLCKCFFQTVCCFI